jgi:nitroreductase/dihydropteridine reductase
MRGRIEIAFSLEHTLTAVLDKLNWRYATKKFDPSKVVPDDTLERIVEAVRLAPTSSGLQPFELLVVTNPALREQIRAIGMNQSQITDCSHLLVFAAWDDTTPERVNAMFDLANEERGTVNEGWENYRKFLLGLVAQRGTAVNFQLAARQAYIALGVALLAAAFEGVDATPMEGFDPDALDQLLKLRERGLRSVLIVPLGYREEAGDWLVKLKKVRRPRAQFVTELK